MTSTGTKDAANTVGFLRVHRGMNGTGHSKHKLPAFQTNNIMAADAHLENMTNISECNH